ncbi:sugar ABC transporter ATP-binding protein [Konateibacter massiliensis]|uniref:sugar ABC transporter ATP-binding protein n=1 Tax=Konateibacter massiliensis TaxID=2002841 RepID=UPI000C14C972|nr:sugar ABC transporter ATP-binding protein [Konateibacter massiliensis]
MSDNTILSLKNVTKRYPGVVALDKLSFELKEGEVHALIGENGAGKSTLIKCLSGAITPEEGTIEIGGNVYNEMSPKLSREYGIEVVYQELNLIDGLTVAENVCFGTEYGRFVNFKLLTSKTKEVFENLHINIEPDKFVFQLSTAQQQLVEIAKAVSKDVRILVLDEPTAPLTTNEVEILFDLIRELKKRKVSVIYISHRMDEIFTITDRVTVMRDGQYITTLKTEDTNKQELIKYMVGRELKEIYPNRTKRTNKPMLELEKVCGGKDRDITLHVNEGEIVGLAGLVGAGRTELARMIFGADKMESGTIKIEGKEIVINSPRDAIQNGIGLIPEDRKRQGCLLDFGIDWNIALTHLPEISRLLFVNDKKVEEQGVEYVEKLKIKTPFINQLVRNLSGGNQQKVVLARTLITNSKVIIFDEPTRGIDVGARAEIYNLLSELADEGKAILMISSDMEELLGMSDRIYALSEGRIKGEISREEFSQVELLKLMSID